MTDTDASDRLRQAVFSASEKVRNRNQLHLATGIARGTLDGYLKYGIQPPPDNMRKIADAVNVTAESLWLRWLGYETPEPGLTRIAREISELRDAIVHRAVRRGEALAQQHSESEPDLGPEADDAPEDKPGKRRA